jgi:hypothetical protein
VTIMHGAIDELNPQKGWGLTQVTTTSNAKLGWGQQEGHLLGQTEDDGWGGRHPLDGVDSGSKGYLSSHPSRSRDSNQSQGFGNITGGGGFAVNFGVGSDAGSAVSAMFLMPRIQPNVTKIVLPTTPAKSPRPDIGEMEPLASIPNLDSEARFTPTRLGIHSKSKSSPSTLELVNQSESELQPTFEDAHSGPNLV